MQQAANESLIDSQVATTDHTGAGVHCWNVGEDIVYADALAANLFGFSSEIGAKGLPIESYMSKIHQDDLSRVSKSIEDAMTKGAPYHEEYRIVRLDGSEIVVVAMGHWFHDKSGVPKQYSGIVFPKVIPEVSSVSVEQLCLIAYDMAQAEGQLEAADRIIGVLDCLLEPPAIGKANLH